MFIELYIIIIMCAAVNAVIKLNKKDEGNSKSTDTSTTDT